MYRLYKRSDGSWGWAEIRAHGLRDDLVVGGVVAYARDITDRKQREHKLERIKTRVSPAVEAANLRIWELDLETGEIDILLRGSGDYLGLGNEGFDSTDPFLRHLHPEDADAVAEAIGALTAGESRAREQFRAYHAETGEIRWIEVLGAANEIDGRRAVHGVAQDITDGRLRERELERFGSFVSHDLRSPLEVARGRLELARENGAETHFDAIERTLDRMDDLIEGLLVLAREGDPQNEPEPVDLGAVARDP